MRTLLREPDGELHAELTPDRARGILVERPGSLLWVDLAEESIDSAEHVLRDVFGFHSLAVDDALRESHVPKVDDWGDYIYVTLHSVTHATETWEALDTLEVDIFVGKGYVVTYESRPVAALERLFSLVQRDDRHLSRGAEHLLYMLADELVSDYAPVLEDIDQELDRLEDDLLAEPLQEDMERIFRLKRALAHLRRIIAPLREVMGRLARTPSPAMDPAYGVFYRDVYDHLVRLYDITESLRDLLTGTLDIYLSIVNNRMNQTIKLLTVVSTLLMPMTFLTGFFGMNFFGPVAENAAWTGDMALMITLALIVAVPIAMYLWMRRRAWM